MVLIRIVNTLIIMTLIVGFYSSNFCFMKLILWLYSLSFNGVSVISMKFGFDLPAFWVYVRLYSFRASISWLHGFSLPEASFRAMLGSLDSFGRPDPSAFDQLLVIAWAASRAGIIVPGWNPSEMLDSAIGSHRGFNADSTTTVHTR